MALRKTILVTGEIYHVLNRSVQGIPIFKGRRECGHFIEAMEYYLQVKPSIKFSLYKINKDKSPINLDQRLVTIINFCIMPNHFHFTLRQEADNGIKKFIQKLTNSFAHYFTVKYRSKGHVFEGNFKAVRIESDEQLTHLSRYIHLNPVSSYLVEKPEDYLYSSYRIYLEKERSEIVNPSLVLDNFFSPKEYEEFVLIRKDYQRDLERIKHLTLE